MKGRNHTVRKSTNRSKVLLKAAPVVDWRAAREWSQQRAADFADVSITVWKSAEYGNYVQLASAERISKAIGIPRRELEESNAN